MKNIKLFSYIFIFTIFLSITVCAEDSIPQTARVGLYYLQSSVNSVDLSSNTGFNVGYYTNDTFTSLFTNTATALTAKKDLDTTTMSTSAYHMQVGTTYTSYSDAIIVADKFTSKGYNAFPVFDGTWKVWVGAYNSSAVANTEVTNLKKILSTYTYTIKEPNANRIQITTDTKIIFIFACDTYRFQLYPKGNPNVIGVNGVEYRGAMELKRQTGSDMTVINIVNLEQYLYSVVACEMSSSWNIEALKAQAVAARTYAVNVLLKAKEGKGAYLQYGFDMNGTTEFQAYKGYSKEAASSIAAVDGTKGMEAYYNGVPIGAYFFSSDGGYTENCENVWTSVVPYLKSVEDKYQPAEFNKKTWTNTATPAEIKAYFTSKGLDIGDITEVKVVGYTPAGNALCLRITGTKGVKEYSKDNIRAFMRGFKGSEFLYSQTFTIVKSGGGTTTLSAIDRRLVPITVSMADVKIITRTGTSTLATGGSISIIDRNAVRTISTTSTPATYLFNGRGWGHGVGMSQWGAKGMADAGFKYDEILKHYYTGIEII